MINLAPIDSKIRAELHRRMLTLNREGPAFNEPQTLDTLPKHSMNNIFSKSTWMRMSSFISSPDGQNENVKKRIIHGGLLNDDGSMKFGFDDIYGKPQSDGTPSFRPIPGIKDLNVEFKGNLATLRQATINWTLWTFEELEEFIPNFLQHGKTVLIEWGFAYDTTNISLLTEEDMDIDTVYDTLVKKTIESAGTYDGMVGVITGYDWSVRDDGGVDCTTTLVSLGVNMLKQQTIPTNTTNLTVESKSGMIESTPTFFEFVEDVGKWLKTIKKSDTTINNIFILGDDTDDNIYVTWGWLEDNLFSKYMGWVNEGNQVGGTLRSIEPWIEKGKRLTINDINSKLSTKEQSAIFESQIELTSQAYRPVTISNHAQLMSPNFKFFILPGQHALSGDTSSNQLSILRDVAGTGLEFKAPSKEGSKRTAGYLRKILFNWNYLVEHIFNGSNNIDTLLQTLFTRMNENVGIWNLKVVSSPDNEANLKIIDMDLTNESMASLISDPSKINTKWDDAEGSLFIFPTWGKDSIVTSQELSGKLPSSMAVAAMYASNSTSPDVGKEGGIQGTVLGTMNEPSQDKILKNLRPAYKISNFGNKSGFANIPLTEKGGSHFSSTLTKKNVPPESIDSTTKEVAHKFSITPSNLSTWKDRTPQFIGPSPGGVLTYNSDGTMKNEGDFKFLDVMKYLVNGDPDISVTIDSAPLIPLSLELGLDGISGIYPGNCFTSDYIPKSYKDKTLFQIMGLSHSVDPGGWKTTLTGQIRIDMSKLPKRKIVFATEETKKTQPSPDVKNIHVQSGIVNDNEIDVIKATQTGTTTTSGQKT